MSDLMQLTGVVTEVRRRNNSRSGNPRFSLTVENDIVKATYPTVADAQFAFSGVEGLLGETVRVIICKGSIVGLERGVQNV